MLGQVLCAAIAADLPRRACFAVLGHLLCSSGGPELRFSAVASRRALASRVAGDPLSAAGGG